MSRPIAAFLVTVQFAIYMISCGGENYVNQAKLPIANGFDLSLQVQSTTISPCYPVWAGVTVTNSGSGSVSIPSDWKDGKLKGVVIVISGPSSFSRKVAISPDDTDVSGKMVDLLPGNSLSVPKRLHLDNLWEYIFQAAGKYTLVAKVGKKTSAPVVVNVAKNVRPDDIAAATLLDNEQVRKLFRLEGGYQYKSALKNLQAIGSLYPKSKYVGMANYFLGLAYARSGGRVCGGKVPKARWSKAEALLMSSLSAVQDSAWKKRTAWWLARCYKTQSKVNDYSFYRNTYQSLGIPFSGKEDKLLK